MSERIVISGWGQITQAKNATPPYLEPVDMMEAAAREAGALSGDNVWQLIDTILVVRTQSRALQSPGEEIARRLGIKANLIRVSGIGGEVPHTRSTFFTFKLIKNDENIKLKKLRIRCTKLRCKAG